jgi:hypothetical protein
MWILTIRAMRATLWPARSRFCVVREIAIKKAQISAELAPPKW